MVLTLLAGAAAPSRPPRLPSMLRRDDVLLRALLGALPGAPRRSAAAAARSGGPAFANALPDGCGGWGPGLLDLAAACAAGLGVMPVCGWPCAPVKLSEEVCACALPDRRCCTAHVLSSKGICDALVTGHGLALFCHTGGTKLAFNFVFSLTAFG